MDDFANNEIDKCTFLLNIELQLVNSNQISEIDTEKEL